MQSTPVDGGLMHGLNESRPAHDLGDIKGGIERMYAIPYQWVTDERWQPAFRQPQPHFPILRIVEPGLKEPHFSPGTPPENHIRPAAGNSVVTRQRSDRVFRAERWPAGHDVAVCRDVD